MNAVQDNSEQLTQAEAQKGKLRVLQVLHTLARAGAEQLVYEMATANRDRMVTAALCLDREGPLADSLRAEGTQVFFTRRQEGFDRGQVSGIAEIIRSFRPDVIHCHQYTPFFYGALARRKARLGRVLFTEHGRHFPDVVSAKRRWFNKLFLARMADHITAVCDFSKQRLIEKDGLPASRIEVVYNGVEVERFEHLPSRGESRSRLGLPLEGPVVVQVGTFRAVKDQATAIRAFQQVRAEMPHAVLAFAGDGPDLPHCRELASDLGLDSCVFFLGSRDDIPTVLVAADLMLMTSVTEAHSVSLLEGMAARLPIVATNVGGIPETVMDEQTGLLAPAGAPSAIAQAVIRLLRDLPLRAKMGQAGYERVRSIFQRKDMHRRYYEIYRSLCAKGMA
jgi:glycosyltransferase involved in cell wall biosynthesis